MICSQILRNSFETSLRLLRKFANKLAKNCERGATVAKLCPEQYYDETRLVLDCRVMAWTLPGNGLGIAWEWPCSH
jgi:hypothetical protein